MIWSIIPHERIFEEQNPAEISLIEYKGLSLLAESKGLPAGRFRVVQLLSTEPHHYLSSELSPGSIIDLTK